MYHAFLFMEIEQSLGNLHYDVSAQVLAEIRQPYYLMEQLATGAKFQYDEIVLAGFGKGHQLDDVGMVQSTHDLNFFQDIGSLESLSD